MSIKVPQVGVAWLLTTLKANWGQLTVRLFTNDHTPADADTDDSFVEAVYSGYGPVAVADWTEPAPNPDGVHYQVQGTAVTFTHNGGSTSNNVFGYWITRQSGLGGAAREVVWAERFVNPPINMAVVGDFITVVPVLQQRSEF